MKQKSKTKLKSKVGSKNTTRKNDKSYPVYYLVAALALVLLLEGFLLGVATTQAWTEAVQILDISSSLQVVTSDLGYLFEPMILQVGYIEDFYQMAATEIMFLFDGSEHDPLVFYKSVNQFYKLASVEMAQLLDLSDSLAFIKNAPQIAGASIFK